MEYGLASSPIEQEPLEWWGPDLSPPAGDREWTTGSETFRLSRAEWLRVSHSNKLLCEPDGMPLGEYLITGLEVVQHFMEDTYDYLITVEWDLDT